MPTNRLPKQVDVLVIGAGNAAMCAALSARETGASVALLERAPLDESGGNSRFTAGAIRCVYDGVEDLRKLMPDLSEQEIENTDFGTYTEEQFFDDIGRITQYRCNPDLAETLIRNSRDTMLWMREQGLRFQPIWGRQAFKVDGKFKFWGGLTVEAWGGGPGLVESLAKACDSANIEIYYDSKAVELISENGSVCGVRVRQNGITSEIAARAVVLPCA